MIREAITYLMCDAVAGARKAGLVKESVAIVARYGRHNKAWQHHINRCKEHISRAVKLADPDRPILVIGAGPCFDVPLEVLNSHPAGAVLLDAVRLPMITKLLRQWPNLTFQLCDVTGLLNGLGNHEDYMKKAPIDLTGYGLIISSNILSQLPIPFANVPPNCEEDVTTMRAIQVAHIIKLRDSGVPTLIISDFKAIITFSDKKSEYTTLDSVVFTTPADDIWTWNMAPSGEISTRKEVNLMVGLWFLNKDFIDA